jgi:hypothetical protein
LLLACLFACLLACPAQGEWHPLRARCCTTWRTGTGSWVLQLRAGEQSRATDQAHPSREWRLSLWYPETRDPESPLPRSLSNKHEFILAMSYYTHLLLEVANRHSKLCRLWALRALSLCSGNKDHTNLLRARTCMDTRLRANGDSDPRHKVKCATRSKATRCQTQGLFCPPPPLVSAACRLSVWGPKNFPSGSQNRRRACSERKHRNDARGLRSICTLLLMNKGAQGCCSGLCRGR